jgi:hypothetical protein
MSLRPVAVCAAVLFALMGFIVAGCYKQERVNAVQHRSAWQREAGESAVAAATIARQSDKNTEDLKQALQKGDNDALTSMSGKLVKLDGEVADQNDSSWTMKKDGWTIVAEVSDTTPHSDLSKTQLASCGAEGIIQKIDPQTKTIQLADVELAPEMKSPMAENVATK